MTKIYANYRKTYFNNWQWWYTPSYLANQQFEDYEWIITLKDSEIPEARYTKVNANWKNNLTRFMSYELAEWVDVEEFKKSVNLIASQNCITLFDTVEEAKQDVRNRTDLEEVEEWKFLISEEHEDEMEWWMVPARYLEIK